MATTRAQASQLLTARELALFDAGAASAARGLDIATLRGHIERARELRDKARDQLRRQRLASRDRTGSKLGRSGAANTRSVRKAELLAEVLDRLLAQRARLKTASKSTAAKKTATKKTATKKSATKKSAAKKSAAKKTPAKKTATKKTAATASARKSATNRPAARKGGTNKTSNRRNGKTSPVPTAAASAVTTSPAPAAHRQADGQPAGHADETQPRMLFGSIELSPKAPVPMEPPGTSRAATSNAGFVSDQARAKAQERHFGEMRGRAIHGHISASDRRNQGKRDNRGED